MSNTGLVSFVVLLMLAASMGAGVNPSMSALWDEEAATMTFVVEGSSLSDESLSAPSTNHSRLSIDPEPAIGLMGLTDAVTNERTLNEPGMNQSAIEESAEEDENPAVGAPLNGSSPEPISIVANGSGSVPANGTGDESPVGMNPSDGRASPANGTNPSDGRASPANGTNPSGGTDTDVKSPLEDDQGSENRTAPSDGAGIADDRTEWSSTPSNGPSESVPQSERDTGDAGAGEPTDDPTKESETEPTASPSETTDNTTDSVDAESGPTDDADQSSTDSTSASTDDGTTAAPSGTSAEDAPAEETTAEDAPAEETTAEDDPAEDGSPGDTKDPDQIVEEPSSTDGMDSVTESVPSPVIKSDEPSSENETQTTADDDSSAARGTESVESTEPESTVESEPPPTNTKTGSADDT